MAPVAGIRRESLAVVFAASVALTVPGKPSDDLAPGTLNSIRKQAGFKK